MPRRSLWGPALLLLPATIGGLAVSAPQLLGQTQQTPAASGLPNGPATSAQVLQGRYLVISAGCSGCHSHGLDDPNDSLWLSGYHAATDRANQIGPFMTYAANLTPDMTTGLGKFADRQIFNALRFGLDPENTPDVVITSTTPGQGNFPATPFYLAPPMPWPEFRNFSDADLWSIVAYLKHGIKPVVNMVPDSQGPPDHWASNYTPGKTGPYPEPPYPAGNETFTP